MVTSQIERIPQSDVLLTLARLLQRNRLTLVVLANNAGAAGARARDAAAGTAAARWLARNALALRLFLAALSALLSDNLPAGYRAIQAVRRPYRRRRAPRLLRHRLGERAVFRVDRADAQVRQRPKFVVSLG